MKWRTSLQVRAGFHGGADVWTRDVLNLGVRPDKLIAKVGQTSKQLLLRSKMMSKEEVPQQQCGLHELLRCCSVGGR